LSNVHFQRTGQNSPSSIERDGAVSVGANPQLRPFRRRPARSPIVTAAATPWPRAPARIVLSACLRARRAARCPLTPSQEGVHLRYDGGPLPDRCSHSLHRAATHIANREDPIDPGLQRKRRSLG